MTSLIALVNRIEARYGSIVKAPDDDPDYQKIRAMYPERNKSDDQADEKIIEYGEKGYAFKDIVRNVHKDNTYVRSVLNKNRIRTKAIFWYTVTGPNGTKCYAVSLKHFVSIVYHRNCSSNELARTYLIARGYKIRQRHTIWNSIRNGNYYLTNYMDEPAIKDGIDSYIYET